MPVVCAPRQQPLQSVLTQTLCCARHTDADGRLADVLDQVARFLSLDSDDDDEWDHVAPPRMSLDLAAGFSDPEADDFAGGSELGDSSLPNSARCSRRPAAFTGRQTCGAVLRTC